MNFKLITFLLLLLVLCSCERRDITYYMESEISVTADWSRAGLEEEKEDGATLVIFPQDGSQPRVLLTGEREYTTVRLPLALTTLCFSIVLSPISITSCSVDKMPWKLLKHTPKKS